MKRLLFVLLGVAGLLVTATSLHRDPPARGRVPEPAPDQAPVQAFERSFTAPAATPPASPNATVVTEVRTADATAPEATFGERELMIELRQTMQSRPEQVISLARSKNRQFPNSPDAPERAWMIVKSLDGLGKHHEARAEALEMLRRYPGTSWTADVERHVLVYPLDQPSREEMQAGVLPR